MQICNTRNLWFLLLPLIGACTPRPLVRLVERKFPGCLYDVRTQEKIVALTLDDGPDATTTPMLLNLLREHNAHATFFLISDHVTGNDSIVSAMLKQGHEIGNHFSSKEASIRLNSVNFLGSFLRADTVLRKFSPVRWVRPGSGLYNEQMIRTFGDYNYQCALGSVHAFDPQLPFAWYTSRVVLHEVYPGAVLVLHDEGYKGHNSEKALRRILPELTKRGYRVVTLSALQSRETFVEPQRRE
ncbi:MAG: polysaccharide deacetylase family protein [Gemmatimonadaceae bacterium]